MLLNNLLSVNNFNQICFNSYQEGYLPSLEDKRLLIISTQIEEYLTTKTKSKHCWPIFSHIYKLSNNGKNIIKITQALLAKVINQSIRTVRNQIKKLCDIGLITVKRGRKKNYHYDVNAYQPILPTALMKEIKASKNRAKNVQFDYSIEQEIMQSEEVKTEKTLDISMPFPEATYCRINSCVSNIVVVDPEEMIIDPIFENQNTTHFKDDFEEEEEMYEEVIPLYRPETPFKEEIDDEIDIPYDNDKKSLSDAFKVDFMSNVKNEEGNNKMGNYEDDYYYYNNKYINNTSINNNEKSIDSLLKKTKNAIGRFFDNTSTNKENSYENINHMDELYKDRELLITKRKEAEQNWINEKGSLEQKRIKQKEFQAVDTNLEMLNNRIERTNDSITHQNISNNKIKISDDEYAHLIKNIIQIEHNEKQALEFIIEVAYVIMTGELKAKEDEANIIKAMNIAIRAIRNKKWLTPHNFPL